MAYYSGSSRDRQTREAQIAQDLGQWDTPLPLLSTGDAGAPVGDTTLATRLPPIGPRRARDYSWEASGPPIYLNGEIKPMGARSFDLPPRPAYRRSKDYTWVDQFKLELIGKDAVNPGKQTFDLPTPRAPRARDYTWEQSRFNGSPSLSPTTMVGTAGATGTNDASRSIFAFNEGTAGATGTNTASLTGAVAGEQRLELPSVYTTPRRARDYSYVETLFAPLIGADAVNPGKQSLDLPPRRAPRLNRFDEGYNLTVWLDVAAQQVIGPGKSTDETALPPRPYARARDYTWQWSLPIPELIGQDALTVGAQLIAPAVPAKPRQAWFDPLENFTLALDFAAQQVIGPGKSTDETALPPKPYARARDYTYEASTFPALIGTDAMVTGEQTYALPTPRAPRLVWFDVGTNATLALDASQNVPLPPGKSTDTTALPMHGSARARDYTHTHETDAQLIGQDAMVTGQSTDRTALPPKGPQRARDYTWLQSYPLHIYEQLPVGDSTALTELPPRAYQRMRDYTYLHPSDTRLIGQDFMVPGQQWTDTEQIPPKAYARMRDYTLLVRIDLPALAEQTHPGHHTLTDHEKYVHGLSDRAKFLHTLGSTG